MNSYEPKARCYGSIRAKAATLKACWKALFVMQANEFKTIFGQDVLLPYTVGECVNGKSCGRPTDHQAHHTTSIVPSPSEPLG